MNKTIAGVAGAAAIAFLIAWGINSAHGPVQYAAAPAGNGVPLPPPAPAYTPPSKTASPLPAAAPSPAPVAAPSAPAVPPPMPQAPSAPKTVTVIYTDAGFTPSTVTIQKGGTVTFKNNSSRNFWPASDPHPAHTGYPESGGCRASDFDVCKPVPPGESWSFSFDKLGTWGYHDHLSASEEGVVIVK